MPGIRIGGAVTFERLSSAITEGVLICAIILILGAAASLTSPHRLLRVLPVYIYEFGVSVVIATSALPQLVSSVSRIRQAQMLRGQSLRGFASWKRIAIPLLEESLARSLDLAAAMDSRGYGISRKRSRYRPIKWRYMDSFVILSAMAVVGLS
jgi:energy-coupling factor transporter transmembrane protein EcfT